MNKILDEFDKVEPTIDVNKDTFTMLNEYRGEQNLEWDKFLAGLLYDALQWREMIDEKIELMNK